MFPPSFFQCKKINCRIGLSNSWYWDGILHSQSTEQRAFQSSQVSLQKRVQGQTRRDLDIQKGLKGLDMQ